MIEDCRAGTQSDGEIDFAWLVEFAYLIGSCPKCGRFSYGQIFSHPLTGDVWECAARACGYNPDCLGCQNGTHDLKGKQ